MKRALCLLLGHRWSLALYLFGSADAYVSPQIVHLARGLGLYECTRCGAVHR